MAKKVFERSKQNLKVETNIETNRGNKMNIHVIEQAEVNVLKSRLQAIRALENNPMGVEIIKKEKIHAFCVKNIPGFTFNTVRGINENELAYLDEVFSFYERQDLSFQVEITPVHGTEAVFRKLSEKNFYQSGFHCSFIGKLEELSNQEIPSGLFIRRLKKDEFTTFAEIYVKSFGLPEFIKAGVRQNNEVLFDVPGWEFYLALYKGKPTGISVLYIEGDVATLSVAATLPEYRGLGIHSALIGQRIQSAKQKGATYIISEASFGSASHRNMISAGLTLAYTKSLWTKI